MTAAEPYRQATPKQVTAFLAALALAGGASDAFEAYLAQLTTMCAASRAPGCQESR